MVHDSLEDSGGDRQAFDMPHDLEFAVSLYKHQRLARMLLATAAKS